MMRLFNRIAATALAAVMAVSMLTACGGGGGGSTGGNGGNGGGSGNNGGSTSVAVPAPDKFKNVGTGSESEGGGSGTLGTPIASFSGSQYAAFVQNVKNHQSTGLYMEYTTVEYGANKAYKSGMNYILAADRNDIYVKMRSVSSTSSVPMVVFGTVENNTEWLYNLYEKSKVAVGEQGAYSEGQLWDDIGFSADDLPYQMYKTVVKVNGQPYDAETFTDSYGAKYTICYQGSMPKYTMIEYAHPDSEGVQYYVTEYKTIQYTTNGLCQWPKDGYKIYKYVSTSQSGNTATIVLADEAGKQYTITAVEGVPNGLTVTDENGNNVTNQFKWLMQGE